MPSKIKRLLIRNHCHDTVDTMIITIKEILPIGRRRRKIEIKEMIAAQRREKRKTIRRQANPGQRNPKKLRIRHTCGEGKTIELQRIRIRKIE